MRFTLPPLVARPSAVLFGALFALLLVVPFGQLGSLRNVLASAVLIATLAVVRSRWRSLPLLLPMALWIGWCALSAAWSFEPYYSLKATYLDWVLGAGVFYGAMQLTQSPGRYCQLMVAATAALILLAGLSIALLMFAPPGAEVAHELRTGLFRYYPGVGVASTCAAFLLPLCLVWLGRPSAIKLVWFIVFVAAAMAVGMVAKNRMFWLAMIFAYCGTFVLAWPNRSSRSRLFSALALMAMVVVAGSLLLKTVVDRSGQQVAADAVLLEKSFVDDPRLKAWGYWLAKAAESPLIGNGYDKKQLKQMHSPAAQARIVSVDQALLTHAHNLSIDILLQTGMIGLALFLWLVGSLARGFWHSRADPDAVIRYAALAGLLLIMVMFAKNFTDDFFENPMILVFWSAAGLLIGRLHAPRDAVTEPPAVAA